MPELPEVETIKNELLFHIIGRQIVSLALPWAGIVRELTVDDFISRLSGRTILGLARRGKYLIFSLDGPEALVMHLRMTGSLLVMPGCTEAGKFVRLVIYLDNGTAIHFRDPRKFGRVWLTPDIGAVIKKLGPEPLDRDFTPQVLAERLAKRSAPIKALLFDQGFIAGVGNMYADEALHLSGIHPLRPGKSLSGEEIERLYRAIQEVLTAAITRSGASVANYYRPGGELGTAHFDFRVAHFLNGKYCAVCGAPLERIRVRSRGTYYCPACQPL